MQLDEARARAKKWANDTECTYYVLRDGPEADDYMFSRVLGQYEHVETITYEPKPKPEDTTDPRWFQCQAWVISEAPKSLFVSYGMVLGWLTVNWPSPLRRKYKHDLVHCAASAYLSVKDKSTHHPFSGASGEMVEGWMLANDIANNSARCGRLRMLAVDKLRDAAALKELGYA